MAPVAVRLRDFRAPNWRDISCDSVYLHLFSFYPVAGAVTIARDEVGRQTSIIWS